MFHNRKLVEKYNLKLKIYDGIPGSPWNGGRIPDDAEIPTGMEVSFALTNHTIDDLYHESTHKVLDAYHTDRNTIIVSNLFLAGFIRARWPLYKLIYSITHYDMNKGWEGYDDLENLFDWIVPRNEIVNEGDALQQRDTSKYILLFSHECSYCPLYNEHYRQIGNIIARGGNENLYRCWFKERHLLEEAGFDAEIYKDYEYMNSRKFHKKLKQVDPHSIAGYKVGRNHQSWEKVEDELSEIMDVLDELY